MIIQLPTAESPVTLVRGDCLHVLAALAENSIDAIVCDPPYELGFMGRSWDASGIAFNKLVWELALRALKPGGHLLAFGGTRTYHRLTCAIEDAGFEIRDSIHWIHRTGFPKSMSVASAIDKAARGCPQGSTKGDPLSPNAGRFKTQRTEGKRDVGDKGQHFGAGPGSYMAQAGVPDEREITTEAAKVWGGWGTALKPAHEPIILARKPLTGTVADNVLEHGTGGLNIDATRIAVVGEALYHGGSNPRSRGGVVGSDLGISGSTTDDFQRAQRESIERTNTLGRWPTNLVFSHLPECIDTLVSVDGTPLHPACVEGCPVAELEQQAGGASRSFPCFRFCAKPARSERDAGCDALPTRTPGEATFREDGSAGLNSPRAGAGRTRGSVLDATKHVLYPPASWVFAVLDRSLPAATVTSLRKVIVGSTIRCSAGFAWSMCWCGSPSTDPSRQDIKSIIGTKSDWTIASKTWSASPRLHTNGCMADAFGVTAIGGNPVGFAG